MSRKQLVSGLVDYFNGEQWTTLMNKYLRMPGEEIYHAHIYVDASVHPDSLYKILVGYFNAIRWPLDRRIDLHSPKPNAVALHGLHPFGGAPHFDFVLRYNKDVVLAPMPKDAKEAEAGENLLGWGKSYQDDFVSQYKFKTVGPKDEQEIRNYFLTTHWKKILQHATDPTVSHSHGYVEINFDPKILELIANEALARIGWTVEKVVPCVFEVHGEYRAKICYMFGNPETVFDIGWVYNPDVVIKPVEEDWINTGTPGFDVWKVENYHKIVAASPFELLTDEEINEVISAFKK